MNGYLNITLNIFILYIYFIKIFLFGIISFYILKSEQLIHDGPFNFIKYNNTAEQRMGTFPKPDKQILE